MTAAAPARRLPPWPLLVPAALAAVGGAVPLVYLILRAAEAEPAKLAALTLRWHNVRLLANTLLLTAGVLAATVAIALPAAWLTTRTDLPARRLMTVVCVLPLAIPSYLMAYALLGIGGPGGASAAIAGIALPRPSGYAGALLALTLYNYPYMFLNLRVSMRELDPSLEETARSLGASATGTFFRVVVPHLRPGFLAGGMLVTLHVLADFGVVSLMRFETFSYAVYLQYHNAYDRIHAAPPALFLTALAALCLLSEVWLVRGLRLDRRGVGATRGARPVYRLRGARYPALAALILLGLASVGVPAATIGYWFGQAPRIGGDVVAAIGDSLRASAPAALVAAALATPIAYMRHRYPGRVSTGLERLALLGYGIPALAFALGMIFFSLRAAPFLYQSLALLVAAYALHFLAEAIVPIRSSLFQCPPQLEEAARSLGVGPIRAFARVTLPLLRNGLVASVALVFLSAMKELPLTFLLAPLDFQTLATNVWSYASEAMFAHAAPYALMILLISAALVGLLLNQGPAVAD